MSFNDDSGNMSETNVSSKDLLSTIDYSSTDTESDLLESYCK